MLKIRQSPLLMVFIAMAAVLLSYSCGQNNEKEIVPAAQADFCSQIHAADSASLDEELSLIRDSLAGRTGVYVLEDGGNSMMARAWLSEHATKSIDVQYFIFSTDNVGLIACDYLVRAADRGVSVRILVDDILVEAGPHEILTLDSHPNIEIKIYNPGINLGKNIVQRVTKFATDFHGANQRMHNKTFTVDEKVVITGGRNIADEYFDYDHEYNFRDRDVMLIGEAVPVVHSSFEQFWNSGLSVPVAQLVQDSTLRPNDADRFERLHQYACNPENFWPQVRQRITALPESFRKTVQSGSFVLVDSVNFISDLPGKNTGATHHEGGITTAALAELIRHARTYIDIQSPYLITTDESRALFNAAANRGVRIRILTNSLASTDNLEAFSGYQRDRKKLLDAGVRIFEFRPDARERYEIMTGELQKKVNYTPVFGLHAKSMVIDGEIAVIGTFNLDPRSSNYNTECITVIHSSKIAKSVQAGMEKEFMPENAWETTRDSNPDDAASTSKRINSMTRRLVPKGIL